MVTTCCVPWRLIIMVSVSITTRFVSVVLCRVRYQMQISRSVLHQLTYLSLREWLSKHIFIRMMYVCTSFCGKVYVLRRVIPTARCSLRSIPAAGVHAWCLLRAQTLVDVFHAPLVRWLEQQEDADRAGTGCPVSRTDIAFVFSNLDELVVFSRCVCYMFMHTHDKL